MSVDLVIIGGTGLYELVGLIDEQTLEFTTPYGDGSAPFQLGQLGGRQIAFLARHGVDHHLAPHQVPYKANMLACSELEASAVVAVNAVGSMNESMPPAAMVLPDQIIDYTWGRDHTFSGEFDGERGAQPLHVDFSEPYSTVLREQLIAADANAQFAATTGTYAATQGPRLESAAEISRLRGDGCDIVGMTGMPEASLARELELNYASVCLVANWAAGFPRRDHPMAAMDQIISNVDSATQALLGVIERLLSAEG